VHFSRFHPMYKLKNLPPTPAKTLADARETGMKYGLKYVYVGNVPGHEGESTFCPGCGKRVVGRYGYFITEKNVTAGGRCRNCGRQIPGVW